MRKLFVVLAALVCVGCTTSRPVSHPAPGEENTWTA